MKHYAKKLVMCLSMCSGLGLGTMAWAEDGYEMWLRYQTLTDQSTLKAYQSSIRNVVVAGDSETTDAIRKELTLGLSGLLAREIRAINLAKSETRLAKNTLLVGTPQSSDAIASLALTERLKVLGDEGFIIEQTKVNKRPTLVVAANTDIGALYGSFHLLRLLQTQSSIETLSVASKPKLDYRVINHWDNLNRVVERGYAGLSLWDWGSLPHYKSKRYEDYARINASLGINGTVINNVNADPRILSDQFLEKVAALADVFRPYGIKVYVSIYWNAPRAFGDVDSGDPLDPRVQAWWNERAKKIYSYIPDFGGFLIKANSEGEPGPQDYNRTHADGANMMARALKPHNGVVFWRAFVYSPDIGDRFRGAYDEFVPLDGQFDENVIVQIKNGPIDFQPREPYSPLFTGLKKTNMMMEFQVTQEYFGFHTHLAYQGPLFEEALKTDTLMKGEGSALGKVLDGTLTPMSRTGMAGVVNPGTDRNWTGHPFVQSSWYAFGRMAWDWELSADEIAEEWLRQTFTNNPAFVDPVKTIMMFSREAGVNYRNPLGLTHLYSQGDHYGPAPWTEEAPRFDWTALYYHRASANGLGFNRTKTGSNAVAQYPEALAKIYGDLEQVPDDLLLWFHNVPWDHKMKSGRTLWNELVHKYSEGVDQVREMRRVWDAQEGKIDQERFLEVKVLFVVQEFEAIRWRDSCLLYFQTYSKRPIPAEYDQPKHTLEEYKKMARTLYVPEPWHPASSSRVLK